MADLTVFPIPQIPNGYNKLGKKLMIHDLTEPEATSTKLINFENILSTSVTYAELVNLITYNIPLLFIKKSLCLSKLLSLYFIICFIQYGQPCIPFR